LAAVARALSRACRATLLNFDVVVASTGRPGQPSLHIVDVNSFPSFAGLSGRFQLLRDFFAAAVDTGTRMRAPGGSAANVIDVSIALEAAASPFHITVAGHGEDAHASQRCIPGTHTWVLTRPAFADGWRAAFVDVRAAVHHPRVASLLGDEGSLARASPKHARASAPAVAGIAPAAQTEARPAGDATETSVWWWVAAGALVAAALGLGLLVRARRRSSHPRVGPGVGAVGA
jgi:hypothetical protein